MFLGRSLEEGGASADCGAREVPTDVPKALFVDFNGLDLKDMLKLRRMPCRYICGNCGALVELKPTDAIRCRECGWGPKA